MKSLALVSILLLGSVAKPDTPACEVEYVRFWIADPDYRSDVNRSPVTKVVFDLEAKTVRLGQIAVEWEECNGVSLCLNTPLVHLAIPNSPDEMNGDGTWSSSGLTFAISEWLDDDTAVIKSTNADGELKTVFIYSSERGVEAFAKVFDAGAYPILGDHHLVGEVGLLPGGYLKR